MPNEENSYNANRPYLANLQSVVKVPEKSNREYRCPMSDKEKLQKAVENTIAAGYQLDSEAFEFLSSVAATQDPTALITKALLGIEELEEKPFFIEKGFLQKFREQEQPARENCVQVTQEESTRVEPAQPTPEGTSLFQPYAKDIETDLKVIDDPSTKLTIRSLTFL